MKYKDVKISTKLLFGFGVIGIMVVALGGLSFFQARQLWLNTSELYDHPFKVNMAVRDIQTNITAIHRSMKDVVLSEDDLEMSKYLNRISVGEVNVYREFETIYSRYLGSKSTIDSAFVAFSNWKGIRDSTIILRQQGKRQEAAVRTTHAAEEYESMLMVRVNALKDFAMNKATEFYTSSEKLKNQLQSQLIWLIGLIFVLICLTTYIIIQAITRPLKILMAATKEQQNGNYSARCVVESTNEMGQLAISFNRMADGIQSEINIKTGITAISDSMLGKEEFIEFGKSLMTTMLAFSKSNIGAIYVLNEDTALFEPKFSVGLKQNMVKQFSEQNYEGEFGRTLLEKKITVIRDIPADSIFEFSAVTGSFKPKEILNIPIMLGGKIIAIISLASLYSYSVETLEMLKIAEKNLTAGLGSILSFQKIRDYSHKLDNQNIELGMQSKELRSQTEELQEQNAELEMQKRQIDEANRLKSEFLSSMSHELRTPLNAVIALSGVLHRKLNGKIPDDEYSYLEIIERNGKSLLTLINEILDLSRIEAGKAEVQLNTFSLKEAVESILDTLSLQVQQKNIRAICKIDSDFPLILTDRSKCHHILQNLIGNAVKFTEKGSVEISAILIDNKVRVTVKDTGIGISAEHLPQIFDQFHQVDGTSSRRHEGTGLGLAIADRYCKLLEARIDVVSELGKGSTFVLVLPVLASETNDSQGDQSPFFPMLKGFPADGFPNNQILSGTSILVIEDSEPAIIQLSEILKEQGYNFKVARNGKDALDLVKTYIPDAIILDLMMPGMDGFEVLENIRGTAATAKIPVLILTAKYLNKNELNRLTYNNIHQLVQKGDVGKDELLQSIRSMIGSYKPNDKTISKKVAPVSKEGPLNILLVEDNEDNVKTIKVLLSEKHHLIIARDGSEGSEMAKSLNPDLILLDISLPLKDGFMVLEEIRQVESLQNVPVIAVTARAMKGDKEHFLKYGFDDYISKPIDSQIFEETINRWILQLPLN